MTFTREELSLMATALHFYRSSPNHGRTGELAKNLKGRIQSHLLAEEGPITVRSPVSVQA